MRLKIVNKDLNKGTLLSAGFEIPSSVDLTLRPGEQQLIKTGIYTAIEPGYVGICKEKSGNSLKRKIRVHAGVIDADYRGEWGIVVSNGYVPTILERIKIWLGYKVGEVEIKKGQSIAQVVFVKLPEVVFEIVESLDVTERSGGYGSTGMGV